MERVWLSPGTTGRIVFSLGVFLILSPALAVPAVQRLAAVVWLLAVLWWSLGSREDRRASDLALLVRRQRFTLTRVRPLWSSSRSPACADASPPTPPPAATADAPPTSTSTATRSVEWSIAADLDEDVPEGFRRSESLDLAWDAPDQGPLRRMPPVAGALAMAADDPPSPPALLPGPRRPLRWAAAPSNRAAVAIADLAARLADLDGDSAAALARVAADRDQALGSLVESEGARAREARERALVQGEALRARHEQEACAVLEALGVQAREERLQEEARLRREAEERRAREAAEARRLEEDRRAAQQEKERQDRERAEEQRREAAAATSATTPVPGASAPADGEGKQKPAAKPKARQDPSLRATEGAERWMGECAECLKAAEEAAQPFESSAEPTIKKERRELNKEINKLMIQIAATQAAIQTKAGQLTALLASRQGAARSFAMVEVARRVLRQCEEDVASNTALAFPLAEVAVRVCSRFPEFTNVLFGTLQRSCSLAVPAWYVALAREGATEEERAAARASANAKAGFKGGNDGGAPETTDAYVTRARGCVLFLGAMASSRAFPPGLTLAWEYLARLLNALPANRPTAAALESLLQTSGHGLFQAFRRQFFKLLRVVAGPFLTDLRKAAGSEAVVARIEGYVRERAYQKPPAGCWELMPYRAESDNF